MKTVMRILTCIALLVVLIMGSFIGYFLLSFYTADRVHKILFLAGVMVIIAFLVTVAGGWLRWKTKLISLGTAICILGLVFGGYQIWKEADRRLIVKDSGVDLTLYEPFRSDTKAASLSEESTLKLEDQLPWLDGATALYPVYAAFARACYPKDDYGAYDSGIVTCSNTVHAYERLIYGETDIIFVAGPSDEQREMAKLENVELHMTPIGKEAFVFFVNQQNPVADLKISDIRQIYSGKETNWKAFGGKNKRIRAFQRPKNSGSQTALEQLMGEVPLIQPPQDDRVDGMGGIIHETAAYRNHDAAIGYSFRFFATEMVKNNQIKLLSMEGVAPTEENIRNGSYPIASSFYAVTNGPPDETEQKLIDWILSEQGQQLVSKTGYTPIN